MIVAESARLRERYEQLHQAEQVSRRASQLEDTRTALAASRAPLADVAGAWATVMDRLGGDDRERIHTRMNELAFLLGKSRQSFATELRQTTNLESIRRSAKAIADDIDASWKRAVQTDLRGFDDLGRIVDRFPDMAEPATAFRNALAAVGRGADRAPRSPASLATFDAQMTSLRARAAAFDGLPQHVRAFFALVLRRTATLADLDGETFDWLRANGQMHLFAIRFDKDMA